MIGVAASGSVTVAAGAVCASAACTDAAGVGAGAGTQAVLPRCPGADEDISKPKLCPATCFVLLVNVSSPLLVPTAPGSLRTVLLHIPTAQSLFWTPRR